MSLKYVREHTGHSATPGAIMVMVLLWLLGGCSQQDTTPIRIGVIHSLTGTMAASETPLVDAVQMAVDEINAQGGVLDRRVAVQVADSRSDAAHAAVEAERLITHSNVRALFGCWTSSCRKAVKPVVEKHHHLLFYPVQYEGLEQSPHILYTGATANQQIIPGTVWALENLGKRVFLVGSDYIFPRVANHIISDVVQTHKGQVIAEHYAPLGDSRFARIVGRIRETQPDVILNTLNGDSNVAFFQALHDAGLNRMPVMSFSLDENGLATLKKPLHFPHYAVWGYFQSLANEHNVAFLRAWHARHATPVAASDPVEAAYVGVKLWAQTVNAIGTTDLDAVNRALLRQTLQAPSGIVAVDPETRHVWKSVRIGVARPDGNFRVVFELDTLFRPNPFPGYHTIEEWTQALETISARTPPLADKHTQEPEKHPPVFMPPKENGLSETLPQGQS